MATVTGAQNEHLTDGGDEVTANLVPLEINYHLCLH